MKKRLLLCNINSNSNSTTKVWFQNRRAKVNRIKQQQRTSSSSSSSATSSPCLLPNELFINTYSPIDILATAAAYVQQLDKEQQKKRKLEQEHELPKKKSWRPWL